MFNVQLQNPPSSWRLSYAFGKEGFISCTASGKAFKPAALFMNDFLDLQQNKTIEEY
ncbi:hypothetical protein [Paenibacillus sp. RC67]|uniref:hypothetical protein n=1 Tax=Paenibacillus sp. RC67 TaxID=3039392 RepID=UPI0024AE50F8|nr:hypothetical protein [Paenibacillus sp. RC67]